MIFALVVLSISLLISILFIISLYDRFDKIRKELDNVKSSVVREKEKLDKEGGYVTSRVTNLVDAVSLYNGESKE